MTIKDVRAVGAVDDVVVEPVDPRVRTRLAGLHERMLAHEGPWGEWSVAEDRDGVQKPYAALDQLATDVYRELISEPRLLPLFDWITWQEGQRRIAEQDLSGVDDRTARMLLTTVLRQHLYADGDLLHAFDCGLMTALVGILVAPPAPRSRWRRVAGRLARQG